MLGIVEIEMDNNIGQINGHAGFIRVYKESGISNLGIVSRWHLHLGLWHVGVYKGTTLPKTPIYD